MGITNNIELEEIGKVVEVEEESNNPYSKELSVKKNSLAGKDLNYFLTNHSKRLKVYKKTPLGSIQEVLDFLEVLTLKEQDETIEDSAKPLYGFNRINLRREGSDAQLMIKSPWGTVSKTYFYRFQSRILPFCCGVCEYGQFTFSKFTKVEDQLVYNLIIDLIRLMAHNNRTTHSGAVGMINTMVEVTDEKESTNTEFILALEQRDDLTFVKQFTNPKTRHTLKMFVFDTQIK